MSVTVKKTKAKILTFTHSTDTTSGMSTSVVGGDVTVRVMTNEDGPASRRVKINSNGASQTGTGRAVVAVSCGGLTVNNIIIDIANAPPAPATFTLTDESGDVDIDP